MKIYLIGMPGSGKSTLGKQLALSLRIPFVDLDEEIERREREKVPDIFKSRGEDVFRQIESELLFSLSKSSEDFVLATGGGAPCFHDGMTIINKTGVSIFLDVPVNALVNRLKSDKNRPLLQEGELEQRLATLLAQRLPVYSQAYLTVSGDAIAADHILELLKEIRN